MPDGTNSHPKSILIVRLGAMGDVLHAMPVAAAFRKTMPETRIGWVIERRWAELLGTGDSGPAKFQSQPLIDAVYPVDTRAWRRRLFAPPTWLDISNAIGAIRADRYEIALDVQGAIKSAVLAKASGAQSIVGFSHPREKMATLFYSRMVGVQSRHVVEMNLELASEIAGVNYLTFSRGDGDAIDLPHSAEDEEWCDRLLRGQAIVRFAILNPGSGWGAKCWPAERYAELARQLGRLGLKSFVNFGPGEEHLAETVAGLSEGTAEPLLCDLAQLIAVTRRASLFVGGDTGPMHLAAALRIPVVALFGPTDPARNGPYATASVVLRSQESLTSYSHVATPDPGLQSITVAEVMRATMQLLGEKIG